MARPDAKASAPADTPVMKQYQAAKARYPRHLLFFRIGDFYELFFEDAKTASRALGLTLTSRHKGEDAVPMAGVPVHTAEQYLARLLRQGFSVAVCDQTEDAAQAKGLVRRDITRVVTPGTVLEDNLLEAKKPNRLAAIVPESLNIIPFPGPAPNRKEVERGRGEAEAKFGLASVDLATGRVFIQELAGEAALRSELARLAPSECLLPEDPPLPPGQKPSPLLHGACVGAAIAKLKAAAFGAREAQDRLLDYFGQNGRDKQVATNVRKLAREMPLALSAAGALLGYIVETHAGAKVLLAFPQAFDPDKFLIIGESAMRSLELIETIHTHSFEGSLLWAIDRTCTGGGGRRLREWLIRPLREIEPLRRRHDAVAALIENADYRADLRSRLKPLADIERIAARLCAGRATPRDLVALKDSLLLFPKLYEPLDRVCGGAGMLPAGGGAAAAAGGTPTFQETVLAGICRHLAGWDGMAELIGRRLKDDCPNTLTDGGLIRDGVDADLDRLRTIASGGKEWIAAFQASEAARSGIASLKVGYNRVFGYYIEISRANSKLAPKDYERRQTLTNAERYTTPALKEREAEVLGAEEKIGALEQKLFLKLREEVAASVEALHAAGAALAELDALCSLAEIAHKKGHVRPVINISGRLAFEQLRHPVLEETLPKGELVPNDLVLETRVNSGQASGENAAAPQILVLTGPNMAGKSTYIRGSALCVILAQMGAFVPAEKAEVGLVDRIFTRVGAADDVAGGRSTFMVEMGEVAEILAGCSSRSLLILDEVGRGTSTYDGVSLAWSLIEYLHNGLARPRTLFATHYHELCSLEDELPRVKNACAAVKEWQGEITFLHRIVPGPSERSFGIHVARLAGVPAPVLERARAILEELETSASLRADDLTAGGAQLARGKENYLRSKKRLPQPTRTDGQLELFEPNPLAFDPVVREVLELLRALDPHAMTPLDALNTLAQAVRKAKGGN